MAFNPPTIEVEKLMGSVSGFCFTVPFPIEINSLIAFMNVFPLPAGTVSTVTIKAQLYEAGETSKIFSPIEETLITLTPSITAETPIGTMLRGEVRANRTVEKNTRLMLVFSATADQPEQIHTIWGICKCQPGLHLIFQDINSQKPYHVSRRLRSTEPSGYFCAMTGRR